MKDSKKPLYYLEEAYISLLSMPSSTLRLNTQQLFIRCRNAIALQTKTSEQEVQEKYELIAHNRLNGIE